MNTGSKISPDELFVQIFVGKKFRMVRHLALAVVIISLGLSNVYNGDSESWSWLMNMLIFIPAPILLNVYVFVPKLLLRNHPYGYMAVILFLVGGMLFLGNYFMYQAGVVSTTYPGDQQYGSIFRYMLLSSITTFIMFILLITGTTCLIILQLWLRDRIRIAELEEASNLAELEMLKNQINPHFLFNMLNNAIVLTRELSPHAKEVIIKLREMLNYQLEKSGAGKIMLTEDIAFLDDLLHLESIRRDRFDYRIMVIGKTDSVQVPPLLFIPFVENAIKHGNDNTRESYILLIFKIENGKLDFFCTNSIPAYLQYPEPGGIGLKNIRRRLELIYGKDHNLDISGTSLTYNVNLTIGL